MMADSGEDITDDYVKKQYIKFKDCLSRKKNDAGENDENAQRQLGLLESWERQMKQGGKILSPSIVIAEFKDASVRYVILSYLFELIQKRNSDDGGENDQADPSSENFSTRKTKGKGSGSWDDEKNINSVEGARKDLVINYNEHPTCAITSVFLLLDGISDIIQRKKNSRSIPVHVPIQRVREDSRYA